MIKQISNCHANPLGLWRYVLFIWFPMVTWLLIPGPASSAPFNSGSTGADGAFAPTENTVLTVPPSGTFNFTTINIPAGVTVTFARNMTNTPVTMLASGNVTISGTISLNGGDGADGNSIDTLGGAGGPGGFAGGSGGLAPPWNGGSILTYGQGLGPGAPGTSTFSSSCPRFPAAFGTQGSVQGSCNGTLYGTLMLLPLIGGSGGNGGSANSTNELTCTNGCNGGGGGGGGGAILIASSDVIILNGSITANGGNGGNGFTPGGPGSGGGIRLIANTIDGSGDVTVMGGGPANVTGYRGGAGRVRLEANTFGFSGTMNPSGTVSFPGSVNLLPTPTLSITTISGVAVPSSPLGSFASPDLILPSSTSNPVTVVLVASNIPVGTVIKIRKTGRNSGGSSLVNSTALSGTDASSTATASVSLDTAFPNVLRAEATFIVQTASNDFPTFAEGEKVEMIRVAAALGGPSSVFLITESGREIPWQ